MNVQQHDETKGVWLLFDVASGDIIDTAFVKYDGIEEIEPIKASRPEPQKVSDPLGAFR